MKEKWKNQKNQKSFDGDCCAKDGFKNSAKNVSGFREFDWSTKRMGVIWNLFETEFQENEYFESDHKKSILCQTKIVVTRRYNRSGIPKHSVHLSLFSSWTGRNLVTKAWSERLENPG